MDPTRSAGRVRHVTGASRRIVRIITRLNIGGPAIQAIELSRELRAEGFETCLVHGRISQGEGDMTALLSLGGTEAVHVPALVRPISPLRDLRALWRIYRTLRRARPDIVHTHMAKAGTLGRMAALLYNGTRGRRPRAVLVHTYHGHVFEGYFGPRSTQIFLAIERWLARRSDALIAISKRVQGDLLDTYRLADAGKTVVIPLGFDLGPFLRITAADRHAARTALRVPEHARVITTVGRLTAIKQQSLFLEMAAGLLERSDRYLFLIVGDGELRDSLERRADELKIRGHVRFLGWRADLAALYAATDVFVLTSRSEGTPVALIEAMAAAVPGVSTDVGGVRDVIPDESLGILVPFGNAEKLVRAVEELSNSATRRDQIGRRARAFVAERFDRQRLLADVTALYWRLLEFRTTMLRRE